MLQVIRREYATWGRARSPQGRYASGRLALVALGLGYVVFGAGLAYWEVASGTPLSNALILGGFVGVPGLILSYGGYRLPATAIQPRFYSIPTQWCLGAIAILAALLTLYHLQPAVSLSNPVRAVLIITAFVAVPAFVAGYNDAKARSRTLELEDREQELEQVRDRMEYALKTTDTVVWDWNVEEDQASFYPSEKSLYGTTVETFEEFMAVVHPDDRDRVRTRMETALATGEPKVEEIRIVRDDEIRWLETYGQCVPAEDGTRRVTGLVRDITPRKTYELKLEASNEQLEQFASIAAHDLQEPLRMISSYLQLIQNRYADELDADGQEFLGFAVEGAERMRAMVDGLLAYSRIDTEGTSREPVELEAVVAQVMGDLGRVVEQSDATVGIDPLPVVRGDEAQLRQVFQNLLENAIEHSGQTPPRIHISVEHTPESCVVSVRDEGVGIDPADHDRIFQLFGRLHTDGENAGTGIGLAICQRVIEHHGGDIWVESTPGEGTTIRFTLPADEPQPDSHDDAPRLDAA